MTTVADRVLETTLTSGTGTLTLAGAVADHRAFREAFATGARVSYVIDQAGTGWEIGLGTLTHGTPDTLSRDTVLASSNAGLKVDFGAGGSVKNVFSGPPGAMLAPLVLDPSGTIRLDQDKGTDIVTAATTNIADATADMVDLTGNATITALGTAKAGVRRLTRTTGTPTFTHDDVSLILPGGRDIVAAAGDVQQWLSLGSGNWICSDYVRASGKAVAPTLPRSHLAGFPLSNNGTTPLRKVDVGPGECLSDDQEELLTRDATLIKQLDAAWTVGNDQGGLDTGTIEANTRYYVFAIKRLDTGVEDVLLSKSFSAPTMPANYTKKRRLRGMLITDGSSDIRAFTQTDDYFEYTTPLRDHNATIGASSSSFLLPVPVGLKLRVHVIVGIIKIGAGPIAYARDPDSDDLAPSASNAPLFNVQTPGTSAAAAEQLVIQTNDSGEIAVRASEATVTLRIVTLAFEDRAGRGE